MARKRKRMDKTIPKALDNAVLFKKTHLEQIEDLAAQNKTKAEIARELGIGRTTLHLWMTKSPEVKEAYERGKKSLIEDLQVTAVMRAKGFQTPDGEYVMPNVDMLKFLLGKLDKENFGDTKTINVNHTQKSIEGLSQDEILERLEMLESKNNINLIDLDSDDIEDADYQEDDGDDNE
jgi:hypothetical protein